jgi:alcohol dehydrogenase
MRAAVYEAFGGPIEVVNVPDPSPPPGGVVLEVEANGVCRSDWHAWMGHDSTIQLPHVPGHEMAGTVAALAEDVEGFVIGDRVTVPFVLGCGHCEECVSGNQQICDNQYQPGFSGWGAMAQYVALPYASGNLVRLPPDISFEAAAGFGCRFSTAYRAVSDTGAVKEGSTLVVWGCGGVGLSCVTIAAALGAVVVAIDIDEDALELATTLGASFTVLSTLGSDDVATVRGLLKGGADVSIDALGSEETAVASMRCLRKRGRHVQVGLMIGEASHADIPLDLLHSSEISMHGVHGMQAWQYQPMFDLIASRRVSLGSLVTETVDLHRGAEYLASMGSFSGTGITIVNDFSWREA